MCLSVKCTEFELKYTRQSVMLYGILRVRHIYDVTMYVLVLF